MFILDLDSDRKKIQADIDRVYKEYFLKKLYEKSKILVATQLDEPTDEQKEWVIRKMKAPALSWRSFT